MTERKKLLSALAKLVGDEENFVYELGNMSGYVVLSTSLIKFIVNNLSTQERAFYDYVLEGDEDGVTSAQASNHFGVSQHHASGVLKMLHDLSLIDRVKDPNGTIGAPWLYLPWGWKGDA